MKPMLSKEEIAALGLDGASFGEAERLSGLDEVLEAQQGGDPSTIMLVFLLAHLPGIEAHGFKVEVAQSDPRCVRVSTSDKQPVEVWRLAGGGCEKGPPSKAPQVRLEPGSKVLVRHADGRGVVIAGKAKGIEFGAVDMAIPLPDLASWCEDCDDPWLRREVTTRLNGGPWLRLTAVGVFGRFQAGSWTGDRARVALARYIRGEDVKEVSRITEWARGLSPDQAGMVEARAVGETKRLRKAVSCARLDMAPTDPAWRNGLVDLCVRRDDIEGMRSLLHARGGSARLDREVKALDREAGLFTVTLPRALPVASERLSRVAATDEDSWWVLPVVRK